MEEIRQLLHQLSSQLHEQKVNLPSIIYEQLQRHQNRRNLVFYGLPEGASDAVLDEIFNQYGTKTGCTRIVLDVLHRLGKPRQDKSPRPLLFTVEEGSPFPHVITLANIMKENPAWSQFRIRRYETADERRRNFLIREERRKQLAEDEANIVVYGKPAEEEPLPIAKSDSKVVKAEKSSHLLPVVVKSAQEKAVRFLTFGSPEEKTKHKKIKPPDEEH
jgi:ribosomal protein L25 (general stress protein Ctc)